MNIFIPKFQGGNGTSFMDRLERGIRHGEEFHKAKGIVHNLAQRGMLCDEDVDLKIMQQKADYKKRMAKIRDNWKGQRISRKAALRPMATIDAKSYFGFAREDPHFWSDKGNIKSYLKDNPECDLKPLIKLV